MQIARRQIRPQRALSAKLPAPMGGINAVDAVSLMQPTDCIYLFNMVAGAEYGLRSRLGWKEWCTNVLDKDAAAGEVRSILPFTGSHFSGSTNKLFACTSKGIYDVTASSTSPTLVWTFGTQTGRAGWGTSFVYVTSAGHFLCYFDEENGYLIYTESDDTWRSVVKKATNNWVALTGYVVGDKVLNDTGKTYVCTQDGTSAGAGGPTGTGSGIVDASCTWDYHHYVDGVDPANFVFGMVWKDRIFAVEKDTAKAWYFPLAGIYDTDLTGKSLNFGTKFRAGGPLVGLYNWTIDGGNGVDDALVAISTGGDVVIYQGTDPSTANTFGMKGVWYVGGVPAGRRIATNYGGDLLILSSLGVVPLSHLLSGQVVWDRSQYLTAKIANLFNVAMGSYAPDEPWALRIHPEDNTLMVMVPQGTALPTNQFVMSLSTKSWSQYRDLPIYSAEAFGGQLYFGTVDGRVCVNTGYLDGVTLANPSAYVPIQWSLLTSFQSLGNANMSQVKWIRPSVLAQGSPSSYQAQARYRYDLTEVPTVPVTPGGKGAWDGSIWDVDVWGGNYAYDQKVVGATGMGPEVAIAIRGTATSRTVLVNIDIAYEVGGLL